MKRRIHVSLEQEEFRRLKAFARQRGWTMSRTIRTAVRALTKPPVDDPLLELSGDIDGLPADLSANIDRYLSRSP